ncbi:MAG: glyoxalase superfamily protein [Duganella sp.]
MKISKTTPILRIFDEAKAKAFYVDYLGFNVEWEHRFEPDLPVYMQVVRDACVLHLSEHHGDCCPGSGMRIQVEEIDALHAELAAKHFKYSRPAVHDTPWGTRDMSVIDPFGNRLTFTSAISV